MRVTITITIFVLILVLAGALASPVNAVQIEALPTDAGTEISEIINTIYKNALGLGGIAALVMITIGAVYFTLSGASPDKQSEGKNYIASALWGLLLLFGAFIILNTINPQITELAEPGKGYAKTVEETTAVDGGGGASVRSICIGLFEDCRAVYEPFFDRDKYILQSKYEIPTFNCPERMDWCLTSINTFYTKMASGTKITPVLVISGQDKLVQGCAVLSWTTPSRGPLSQALDKRGRIEGLEPGAIEIKIGRQISGEGACTRGDIPE